MTRLTTLTVAIAGLLALAPTTPTAQAGDRACVSFGVRVGSHDGRSGLAVSYHKSDYDRRYSAYSRHRSTRHAPHHTGYRYSHHRPSYHTYGYTRYRHPGYPVYTRRYPVVVRHRPVVTCPPPVVVHQPVVRQPVVVHHPPIVHEPEPIYHELNGWQALADRQDELAKKIFHAKRVKNSRIGGPIIGGGIAHLVLGNDRGAHVAFIRAVRIDPGAFDRIPNNPALLDRLARQAQRLEYRGHSRHGTFNDLVSAAALRIIMDDDARAGALLDEAIARGDRRASTLDFKQLLGPIHPPQHHGHHQKRNPHHDDND